MTSIFRKLTGRRKKTKPTNSQTSYPDIFTESSHASELDAAKTSSRPQHLEHQTSVREKTETPRRPRSRSNDRSKRNIISSGTAGKTDRSGTPQRNGRSGTPSREDHGVGDDWAANGPSSSNTEDKSRKSRFSFSKPGSYSKIQTSGSATYDSEDETAATSTATAPLKRGRKPRTQKTPDVSAASPSTHAAPQTPSSTRVVRVVKTKRVFLSPGETTPSASGKRPPESALMSPPSSSRVSVTGGVVSMMSPEDIAKQLAQNKETERIARAAAALDNRGNEYFERGYYDKAMDAYTRALKLKRRTFHSMLEEADEIFDETAENEKLDSNDRDMDPKLLVSMATSINNIGYLRQRAGEATPDETMAAYKKSLRIKRKILGNDSLSVGKTLNNIGSVYYLKKEFDGALPAYEEALAIMQSNLGEDHPDVATVISNMGDVCLAMKNKGESLVRYRTALNIRWANFGEKDPRTMRLLEKIARIEIGDSMPTPRGISKMERQVYDWDESELYDLDLRPISHELRELKDQLKEDIEAVDQMERNIAMGMVRDKLKIVRGMRELSEAQDRGNSSFAALLEGSFSYGDDSARDAEDDLFSPQSHELRETQSDVQVSTDNSRSDVQARVKERLNKLRLEKGLPLDGVSRSASTKTSTSTTNQKESAPKESAQTSDPEPSSFLRSALYSTGQQQNRAALSTLKPDEIKEQVDDIESALKLKKGIDNLRSFAGATGVEEKSVENSALLLLEPEENSTPTPAKAELENPVEEISDKQVDGPAEDGVQHSADALSKQPLEVQVERADQFFDNPDEELASPKMMHATWLGEVM